MKTLFTILILCIVIQFFSLLLIAQSSEVIEKYSKVRITIQDKTDLLKLQLAGLSLEGMQVEENSVALILSEREITKLSDLGFSYEMLIVDMSKYYVERNRRTETEIKSLEREMKEKYSSGGFGFGSMGGFYTYDEVVAELDTMRMLYPDLITAKYSIGTTLEGRTIWAVKISDNPDITEGESEVFYNALIHAREGTGMMSVIYFMYHLLENYGIDPEITYLVDNRELYFVPVINVDGYVYNQQTNPNGGGMWRKNRKDNGNGCYGIDLNRNFGYMWGYDNIGSSPDPCSELYRGTAAFSEFESQAIKDFCNGLNILLSNNFHTYGNVVFPPWGYNLEQTPDSVTFNHLIELGTCFNGHLHGLFLPPSHWLNYPSNGDAADWMYGEQTTKPKMIAVITEVGKDNDGFWPIPERIFPLASENCYPNKVLAWGPGVIVDPPHITEGSLNSSYFVPVFDSVHITAVESNPENYNSVVTAYLYNINDNLVDEFEMSEIVTNTFYNSYPAQQEENFYYFILKDEGLEIPSILYYTKNLKFTTAGPIKIDSLIITYNPMPKTFRVVPLVRNTGQTFTVDNLSITMSSDDSTIIYSIGTVLIDSIQPGEVVLPTSGFFTVKVDSNFSLPFKFNFAIKSDGWLYWRDTISIVTSIESDETIPEDFILYENYPNPFNPGTTIRYSIPTQSKVVIKVYDILGNEIATLINEEKSVGTYELTWNASSLPSGVYFYQLKAGSFVETNKMVLIK